MVEAPILPAAAKNTAIFHWHRDLLLKAAFGEQQESSVQDYIEASLMLQYNKRHFEMSIYVAVNNLVTVWLPHCGFRML